MGRSRRQAVQAASDIAGDDGLVLWMEPEKYTLVGEIEKMVDALTAAEADVAVSDRGPLDSYPLEQRLAEPLGNLAFELITGHKLDMWSGPRLMNSLAVLHFLAYVGEYGDKWDAIFIPVIRMIAHGLKVVSAPVNYVHPPEQTLAEGTADMVVKRVIQLHNLVPAMYDEAAKLGILRT
jgi:hypothetical protein